MESRCLPPSTMPEISGYIGSTQGVKAIPMPISSAHRAVKGRRAGASAGGAEAGAGEVAISGDGRGSTGSGGLNTGRLLVGGAGSMVDAWPSAEAASTALSGITLVSGG